MASKNSSCSSNDDDEHQKFRLKNDAYDEYQFETNNEGFESFTTDPYSMTDIKDKESSTNSWSSTKSTNENLYKYNTIIKKTFQDFNAFNKFLLNNIFDIRDYTLIASNFLDEDIIREYKKKQISLII
jgi:hypothetical protein